MSKKRKDAERLRMWQERLSRCEKAYQSEIDKMDGRERQYLGTRKLRQMVRGDKKPEAVHVRNISAELIEAQVSSDIPQPKVTARRQGDEEKAKLIEDMIRNELDRMPFEELNDMMERTVPIQGGAAFLVEWDNTKRTHFTVGELTVSALHPKQLIPQDGVYSGIEDMDYIFLKLPQTKESIRMRYGAEVCDEAEDEPEVRSLSGDSADDMVTQYVAYYRNKKGGIGLYSWVGDTVLEDLEDYQARRLRRCAMCGAVEPAENLETVEPLDQPGTARELPFAVPAEDIGQAAEETKRPAPAVRGSRKTCPYCGGTKWEESEEEYEELYVPVLRSDGSQVPGAVQTLSVGEPDENGVPVMQVVSEPTRIPFYKPDVYPVILQKNVSVYGQFLGDSDLDKIADQQNTVNRIETKIIDKLLTSGSYMSLPADASIRRGPDEMKIIYMDNPAEKQLVDVYDMEGNITQDLAYLNQVYEEARQIIGVTDSFQGRRDTTATSGKAKEFAAAQSAGRLESKRVMRQAAYAALFEAMFKFRLAYADEPRPVVADDIHGNKEYKEFNRYDFLERDAAGEWCWNDQFLFSCDTAAPLASNREAMWQETRLNLQTGAFGDPANPRTLILFWTKMELLHYPGAGETRRYLEEELEMMAQQSMAMPQGSVSQPAMPAMGQADFMSAGSAQPQDGRELRINN